MGKPTVTLADSKGELCEFTSAELSALLRALPKMREGTLETAAEQPALDSLIKKGVLFHSDDLFNPGYHYYYLEERWVRLIGILTGYPDLVAAHRMWSGSGYAGLSFLEFLAKLGWNLNGKRGRNQRGRNRIFAVEVPKRSTNPGKQIDEPIND